MTLQRTTRGLFETAFSLHRPRQLLRRKSNALRTDALNVFRATFKKGSTTSPSFPSSTIWVFWDSLPWDNLPYEQDRWTRV